MGKVPHKKLNKAMRVFSFIFISLMIIYCRESTYKQTDEKPFLKKSRDTLRLVEILSFNALENTSLVIIKDSVYFVTPDPGESPDYCSVRVFYYDPINKRFRFANISSVSPYEEVCDGLLKSRHKSVYIKSVGNLNLKYPKLPDELKNEKELKEIINPETKIQSYNGSYFFIDRTSPKLIHRYDSAAKRITSFTIPGHLMAAT